MKKYANCKNPNYSVVHFELRLSKRPGTLTSPRLRPSEETEWHPSRIRIFLLITESCKLIAVLSTCMTGLLTDRAVT